MSKGIEELLFLDDGYRFVQTPDMRNELLDREGRENICDFIGIYIGSFHLCQTTPNLHHICRGPTKSNVEGQTCIITRFV